MSILNPLQKGELLFPHNFLWGASTSSHQVEGGNHNDWTEWEKKNAKHLAAKMTDRYKGAMPAWKRLKAEISSPENYISGKAADHYHLYEQDFDAMHDLHLNAYRFSIEWSRVEPEEGKFDEREIAHYNQMLQSLHKRKIEPFVTLWHWTLPTWLSDMGGWENPRIVEYYCRFVHKIASACPSVRHWITLNEPEVYTRQGYITGHWPPEKRRHFLAYMKVTYNLARAHNHAYDYIKDASPLSKVGLVVNNTYFQPLHNRLINRMAAGVLSWFFNRRMLNMTRAKMDFIGLNYYFRTVINLRREYSPKCELSDIGWELCSFGMYHVVKELKRYKLPVYITENGLADGEDAFRGTYIAENLGYIHKAIMEGVNVKGYFHWSLLDNFEWDKGFWPRFGLIEVDFKTQRRRIRESAYAYGEVARTGRLYLE